MKIKFQPRLAASVVCFFLAASLVGFEAYERYNTEYEDEACDHDHLAQADPEGESDNVVLAEVEEELSDKTLQLTVGSGDTLASILKEHAIESTEVHQITASMRKHFSPRSLRPGHEMELTLTKQDGRQGLHFSELRIRNDLESVIIVKKKDDGSFASEKKTIALIEEKRWAESPIFGSLYETAAQFKVPNSILHKMIQAFSYDVDFQRSLQDGDIFGVMYTVKTDPETGRQRPGELLYATIQTKGRPYHIYLFKTQDGIVGFYNQNGESIRKGLLRTPVDGARISSRFGNRHHPVLGYTKKHKGVDFACPTGTPVMAAGDGVVEKASRYGAYGNYVSVRHANGYSTAYGHLSRYAKGIRPGHHVKQGQVIAYVGATGRATGPHLHYEVLVSNKQINPLSVKLIPAAKLTGKQREEFLRRKKEADFQYAELKKTTTLAGSASTSDNQG